ncbi:ABC transporter substrate-binding protein [Rhodopseudomonas palustris]
MMLLKREVIGSLVLGAATVLGAAAFAAEPLRIGILNDQSGSYSDVTGRGSVVAAQLAVEEFGGSVDGRPIEIVVGDHQNKPDIASALTRRWFDTERIQAIFDVPHSAAALAVIEVARERKKVVAISGALLPDITGKLCSPTTFHWAYDSYAVARTIGSTLVKRGSDKWFFVTVDTVGGHLLARDTMRFVTEAGGQVLGEVRHPFAASDFSSFLLRAQSARPNVIAAANAGGDTVNTIKQANEFGLTAGGTRVAGMLVFLNDVHAMGLQIAGGIVAAESYYWDLNDDTRAWHKKFSARNNGRPANMIQAGVYSAVLHYLKAVKAAGTDEGVAVGAKMRELRVNDAYTKNVEVRVDGRVMRDMHVFEVKKPDESKGPWDYYKLIATVPGEQAFRPLSEGECPLAAAR